MSTDAVSFPFESDVMSAMRTVGVPGIVDGSSRRIIAANSCLAANASPAPSKRRAPDPPLEAALDKLTRTDG